MKDYEFLRDAFSSSGMIGTYDPEELDLDRDTTSVGSKRIRIPRGSIDWPTLINQLRKDANMTHKEIARLTGISDSFLKQVESEVAIYQGGDKALALICLHILNTGRKLPMVGDYNPL